jgi:hypothetical protein
MQLQLHVLLVSVCLYRHIWQMLHMLPVFSCVFVSPAAVWLRMLLWHVASAVRYWSRAEHIMHYFYAVGRKHDVGFSRVSFNASSGRGPKQTIVTPVFWFWPMAMAVCVYQHLVPAGCWCCCTLGLIQSTGPANSRDKLALQGWGCSWMHNVQRHMVQQHSQLHSACGENCSALLVGDACGCTSDWCLNEDCISYLLLNNSTAMPKVNISMDIVMADNLTKCVGNGWIIPNYFSCIQVWCTYMPMAVIVVLAGVFLSWEWLFPLWSRANAAGLKHSQPVQLCLHV